MQEPEVKHNESASEFSITIDGKKSKLSYVLQPGAIDLVHTRVPDELQGTGLGDRLVEAAIEYAKANQLEIIATCPFVTHYFEKRPEVGRELKIKN